jgi:hypothetical protein
MTRRVAASSGKPDRHPTWHQGMAFSKLLNRFAANPWALSFSSFVVTALLIQSKDLRVF